jgi:hypothetical protein
VLANVTKHVFLIPDTFPTEKGAFPGSFSPWSRTDHVFGHVIKFHLLCDIVFYR